MKVKFWGVRGSIPTPLTLFQLKSRIAAVIQRIKPDDLKKILDELRKTISLQSIGLELHPNFVTTEDLRKYKEIGIEKVSIGVESTTEHVVCDSNRIYTDSESYSKIFHDIPP